MHGVVLIYMPAVDENRPLAVPGIELSLCDTTPKVRLASQRPPTPPRSVARVPKPAVKERRLPAKIPANQVKEVLPAPTAALSKPRHTVLKPIVQRPRPAEITPHRAEKNYRVQAVARSQPQRAGPLIEKVQPNSSRAAAAVRKTTEAAESAVKHSGEDNDKIRQEYLRLVRTRIARHKKYPGRARIRWLQGEVTIRLCLTPAGEMQDLIVSKSSGREILDQAAVQAVRDAVPFPRPPENIFKGKINLELTIIFKLS